MRYRCCSAPVCRMRFLTDKAKALKEDYDAISDRMSAIFYQGFTEDEIRNFEEYLERIRLNLEGWQPE